MNTSNKIDGGLMDKLLNSTDGIPFTDEGIDGTMHELIVKESGTNRYYDKGNSCVRKVYLYSISKAYYDYLVSILSNDSDASFRGTISQLGLAEQVPIFTNIVGGIGIFGCLTHDEINVQIVKQ